MKPSAAVRRRAQRVLDALAELYPDAHCALDHQTPIQLLVATILSAQCTDARVNLVTPPLFARFRTVADFAHADPAELERLIASTGFFRNKAKNIRACCRLIVDRHGGEVPGTLEELVALPGVGRKTANVVLGHALGVPGLPVDRHVLRVSNRIGIASSEDPEVVEQQLCKAMPPADWTKTSDTLILHGRRICKPRPLCDKCVVRDVCDYYRRVLGAPLGKPVKARRPPVTIKPGTKPRGVR